MRVAVNLGRSLRADEGTGAGGEAEVEAGFIAGHKAAAKTAEIHPDAFAARPRHEELERAGSPRRGHGTLVVYHIDLQPATAGRNHEWGRRWRKTVHERKPK